MAPEVRGVPRSGTSSSSSTTSSSSSRCMYCQCKGTMSC
jgi:hypothetical protein